MTLLRLHFLVHEHLVHLDKSSLQTLSHRQGYLITAPLQNDTRWRKELLGQAIQIVEPEQVLHAAKENASAYRPLR